MLPQMDIALSTIGILILGGVVFLVIRSQGKLSKELEEERSKKNILEGQTKQLDKENSEMKMRIRQLEQLRDQLNDKLIAFEKERGQQQEKLEEKIKELGAAKNSFDDERSRVRGEDEERRQIIIDERNRLWNEHQNSVGAKLKEICQRPEIGFNCYEAANLPSSFDGSLKPDFLVEIFPEQYLIFDAKFSENKIATYFAMQVPATVQKIKKSSSRECLYPTLFFVVPSDLLQKSKKIFAFENGLSFFMISLESLAPILACYKKITEYEFADQMSPQDRENIVNVISEYETFIRNQNSMNVLLAKKAIDIIDSRENLSIEINSEIDLKRKNIKLFRPKESDVKKLAQSVEEMGKHLDTLTSPKADLERHDLEEAKKSLLTQGHQLS